MILWTPLPIEAVTEGLAPAPAATMEVRVRGRLVEVAPVGAGAGRVVRLHSTDPLDYLSTEFQPGAVVRWDLGLL